MFLIQPSSSFLIILHTPSSDESAICSLDLLQTFARSRRGTSAARYLHDANAPQFTLVPGISYHGFLSMSVAEHNFKARDFKHFLKWKLVSPPIWSFTSAALRASSTHPTPSGSFKVLPILLFPLTYAMNCTATRAKTALVLPMITPLSDFLNKQTSVSNGESAGGKLEGGLVLGAPAGIGGRLGGLELFWRAQEKTGLEESQGVWKLHSGGREE
ncbi:hypothetical protein VP01_2139g7 [Puccinia sorghi]|uniref:Uncharacterized protein n=1 Tax=Puccinia sorghi TaxID=27349 RepID=A0A0L6VBL9_9BASI|nr:hypothetical protein VP01_2139g7 [Puccinia sorghi]